jgi:hypothetical protein
MFCAASRRNGARPCLPAIRAQEWPGNLDAAGGRMKEIIEKEAIRRTALFEQALELMAPITQVVRSAKQNKAMAGLHLYPPTSRGMTYVSGILLCRSFHLGVGRRRRRYLFWVSPSEGTITICLESGHVLDRDDADHYQDNEEVVWEETYYKDKRPTIVSLKEMIEEALITDAVEANAKLGPRGV